MSINVRVDAIAISIHIKGCSVRVEQARGPSYFGEAGERKPWFNLFSLHGKSPLAQADTAEELMTWAKKHGARRVGVF